MNEVQLGLRGRGPLSWHLLIKDCLVLFATFGARTRGIIAAQLLISFIHLVEEGHDIIIGNSLISVGVVVEVFSCAELRINLLELLCDGLEQIREPVVFLKSLVSTPQLPPVCFFLDPREVDFIEIKCGSSVARVTGTLCA